MANFKECGICGKIIEDGEPHIKYEAQHVCCDCALKIGLLPAIDWLDIHGIDIYEKADYENGVITAYQKWGRGYRKDEIKIE